MSRSRFVAFSSGFVVGCIVFSALAAWGAGPPDGRRYTITDLGPGFVQAIAKENTTVVGTQQEASGAQVAREFTPANTALPLLPQGTFSAAEGVLHAGRIVGWSSTDTSGSHTHAVAWENGVARDLGTLGSTDLLSQATAATTDDIGGVCSTDDLSQLVPCVWVQSQNILQLDTLGGPDGHIEAMNEQGDALGNSLTAAGATHCTYWPAAGGVIDCNPPGATLSFGLDMNSAGLHVGFADVPAGRRAFVGLPYGQIILAPLAGGITSTATGINDLNEIVGTSRTPGQCASCPEPLHAATIWIQGQPYELLPAVTNGTGWQLLDAIGLNNDGLIIGVGTLNGVRHSFLLIPQDNTVVAWYRWKAGINRWYQHRYDRWRKSIDWYYAYYARRAAQAARQ